MATRGIYFIWLPRFPHFRTVATVARKSQVRVSVMLPLMTVKIQLVRKNTPSVTGVDHSSRFKSVFLIRKSKFSDIHLHIT